MSIAAPLITAGALVLLGDFVDQQFLVGRDWANLMRVRRLQRRLKEVAAKQCTYADFWDQAVTRYRHRVLFGYQGMSLTFHDMDLMSNRYAHWLLRNGIDRKDVVAIFMDNCPHFVAFLLALSKIGARVALINGSLRDNVLLNCIEASHTTAILFGAEKNATVAAVEDQLTARAIQLIMCDHLMPLPPYQSTKGRTRHTDVAAVASSTSHPTAPLSSSGPIDSANTQRIDSMPDTASLAPTTPNPSTPATSATSMIASVAPSMPVTSATSATSCTGAATQTTADSDAQSISNVVSPIAAIVGKPRRLFEEAQYSMEGMTSTTSNGRMSCSRARIIDDSLDQAPNDAIPVDVRMGLTDQDIFCYVYTSGTTDMMLYYHYGFDLHSDDIIYSPLPLYHFAGLTSVGAAISAGACLIITPRFSVRRFWEDVRSYDCTVIQYIGEQCRYLLRSPVSPFDQQHRVRLAFGNGLRPDIFRDFQIRFNIPEIAEYYTNQESSSALLNRVDLALGRGTGAVGHIGPFTRFVNRAVLVRVDPIKGEPLRANDGRCVLCKVGQPGELLSRYELLTGIPLPGTPEAANVEPLIVRDVLHKGDVFLRTGDLLRMDEAGFYYFVDRVSDNFRWKGENVSTAQVEDVVIRFPGVVEAIAYGIPVPGYQGKTCMCSVVLLDDGAFHPTALAEYLSVRLLPHAIPQFIRVLSTPQVTRTFRYHKVRLQHEGFDISRIQDPVYWHNRHDKTYVRLNEKTFRQLQSGATKL